MCPAVKGDGIMSYLDFGAYVTRDGVHRPDREDCGVWDDAPKMTGAASEYGVLGDGRVLVNLGRPCMYPTVWVDGRPWGGTPDDGDGRLPRLTFTVEGHRVDMGNGRHYSRRYGRTSWARLTQPDGTVWEGECGMAFGAGHTDRPMFIPHREHGGGHPVCVKWHRLVPCSVCRARPVLSRTPDGAFRIACPSCGLALHGPSGRRGGPSGLRPSARPRMERVQRQPDGRGVRQVPVRPLPHTGRVRAVAGRRRIPRTAVAWGTHGSGEPKGVRP